MSKFAEARVNLEHDFCRSESAIKSLLEFFLPHVICHDEGNFQKKVPQKFQDEIISHLPRPGQVWHNLRDLQFLKQNKENFAHGPD